MIKAVLLDLDETLIYNPGHLYAQAFLAQLELAGEKWLRKTGLAAAFRHALQELSHRHAIQNQDVLVQIISSIMTSLKIDDAQAVQGVFREFASTEHLALRDLIRPVAEAAHLVEACFRLVPTVVLATNPLYESSIIEQRLEWGGLGSFVAHFDLITSADVMHTSKPNPAYYAEILGRVGVEPDEAVMIGNDLHKDIEPANQLGLHTIHVVDRDFTGVVAQLETLAEATTTLEIIPAMIDPQLQGNVHALRGLLASVHPSQWALRPDPDEWSILQILCHLEESERNNERPRLERILHEEIPFLTARRPPGPHIPTCDEAASPIVARFVREREQTRMLLKTLSEPDWQRRAHHNIFGRTTLVEMAHFTAQHDRLHLNQLCQMIGRCAIP